MKKKIFSLFLVLSILVGTFSTTAFAQFSNISATHVVVDEMKIGGCRIVITDENLLAKSKSELDEIVKDVIRAQHGSNMAKSAESERHSCSPIGPYAYKVGGWNFIYDAAGELLAKFRTVSCVTSSCSYSDRQIIYY